MIEIDTSGALLFGRYAFAPNRFGYCGPDDHPAMLQYVSQRAADQGLIELERQFDGAYPYLRLIALCNNIADPFDHRVVEAYWIGNDLLEQVAASPFYESLRLRFNKLMSDNSFGWLASKLEFGARPHHNFHVFEVYRRKGTLHDNRATVGLARMDSCRISWGRVAELDGAEMIVERPELVIQEGKFALTEPQPKRVTRQIEGRGFADNAQPGDFVSVHWDWACEKLTPSKLQRLIANTNRYLALANTTI